MRKTISTIVPRLHGKLQLAESPQRSSLSLPVLMLLQKPTILMDQPSTALILLTLPPHKVYAPYHHMLFMTAQDQLCTQLLI